MLPRPVISDVEIARDGKPQALIVAPREGPFAQAGRRVQGIIREMTGVSVPIRRPEEVTGERGILLKPEAKRVSLVFVGNLSVNPALFEPYARRMLVADEKDPGPDGCAPKRRGRARASKTSSTRPAPGMSNSSPFEGYPLGPVSCAGIGSGEGVRSASWRSWGLGEEGRPRRRSRPMRRCSTSPPK